MSNRSPIDGVHLMVIGSVREGEHQSLHGALSRRENQISVAHSATPSTPMSREVPSYAAPLAPVTKRAIAIQTAGKLNTEICITPFKQRP